MATHKSAEKRARQSLKRREHNSGIKKTVRTVEKKLRKAIEEKNAGIVTELLREFMSRIDRAAKRRIFHPNAASRKVARLSKQASKVAKA